MPSKQRYGFECGTSPEANLFLTDRSCFRPEGLAFSFNGGKDSTAVLHVLLRGVQAWMQARGNRWVPQDGLAGMHVFFFKGESDFQEIDAFIQECDEHHHLSLKVYTCDFKTGLVQMLSERPIKGIFLGTRHGDPNCGEQVRL
jgi:FAD synthetase